VELHRQIGCTGLKIEIFFLSLEREMTTTQLYGKEQRADGT